MKWVLKMIILSVFSASLFWAQEPDANQQPATTDAQTQPGEEQTQSGEELTESQRNTRAVSLAELRKADERLNQEREALVKRERRLQMLIEDIENQEEALAAKESELVGKFRRFEEDEENFKVPPSLVAHYESRGPKTAAEDFIKLWANDPRVAVALVRDMKKKKSAALIDEVARLGENGKTIAARIHEAIGTGRIPSENI